MELTKEDFILVTVLDGRKVLALRPDYFDEQPIEEVVKEAMEEKKEVEISIGVSQMEDTEIKEANIEVVKPEPTEEELAEIEKQKLIEEKKAELAKLLEE